MLKQALSCFLRNSLTLMTNSLYNAELYKAKTKQQEAPVDTLLFMRRGLSDTCLHNVRINMISLCAVLETMVALSLYITGVVKKKKSYHFI